VRQIAFSSVLKMKPTQCTAKKQPSDLPRSRRPISEWTIGEAGVRLGLTLEIAAQPQNGPDYPKVPLLERPAGGLRLRERSSGPTINATINAITSHITR
jgi:hypothetical protein